MQTKHAIEPYDFNTSKKKQLRDRIFNCDNIEEMMTKEEKEDELAKYEVWRNEFKDRKRMQKERLELKEKEDAQNSARTKGQKGLLTARSSIISEDLKNYGAHYNQYTNYRSGSLMPIRRPLPNTP